MPKKTVYESKLVNISSPSDGAKYLALSVIKRAIADLNYSPRGEPRKELREWLARDAWPWGVLAGGKEEVIKQGLWRKFSHS